MFLRYTTTDENERVLSALKDNSILISEKARCRVARQGWR